MYKIKPQFRIKVFFHFEEHDESRQRSFVFLDNCRRDVPMHMENIEGLNTVGMLIDKPKTFYKGDSYELDCVVLAPELFENSIIIGSKGKLWEVGYFADVTVIKIYNDGWPSAS